MLLEYCRTPNSLILSNRTVTLKQNTLIEHSLISPKCCQLNHVYPSSPVNRLSIHMKLQTVTIVYHQSCQYYVFSKHLVGLKVSVLWFFHTKYYRYVSEKPISLHNVKIHVEICKKMNDTKRILNKYINQWQCSR